MYELSPCKWPIYRGHFCRVQTGNVWRSNMIKHCLYEACFRNSKNYSFREMDRQHLRSVFQKWFSQQITPFYGKLLKDFCHEVLVSQAALSTKQFSLCSIIADNRTSVSREVWKLAIFYYCRNSRTLMSLADVILNKRTDAWIYDLYDAATTEGGRFNYLFIVKHKETSIFHASFLLLLMNLVISWKRGCRLSEKSLFFQYQPHISRPCRSLGHFATFRTPLRGLKPRSSLRSLSYSTLKLMKSTCGRSRKIDFNLLNWIPTTLHLRYQWVSSERIRARNMFDKAVTEKCFAPFDQVFDVVQALSNTIQHDPTRCPNGKMFGHKTVFERVWSPNISRLDSV